MSETWYREELDLFRVLARQLLATHIATSDAATAATAVDVLGALLRKIELAIESAPVVPRGESS